MKVSEFSLRASSFIYMKMLVYQLKYQCCAVVIALWLIQKLSKYSTGRPHQSYDYARIPSQLAKNLEHIFIFKKSFNAEDSVADLGFCNRACYLRNSARLTDSTRRLGEKLKSCRWTKYHETLLSIASCCEITQFGP